MIPKFLGALSFIDPRRDDDIFDRLSYYYTTLLLILFSVLVSFKQYGGHPIECWMDASFKDSWEEYAENYCWAKNTYYVSMRDHEMPDHEDRKTREVSYYQWFPFILLFQAMFFYAPCLIWRLANNKSGFNIHDIVNRASASENLDPSTHDKNVEVLSRHFTRIICSKHEIIGQSERVAKHGHRVLKCFNLRFSHGYVSVLYTLVKILYCVNLFLQLYFLNRFLQTDDGGIYGFRVISDLLHGKEWEESGYFPRVTFCDFKIRLLGNVQTHSVQCVLVINIFTEKIFIILWFWFVALAISSCCAFLGWLWALYSPWGTMSFLHRHMEHNPIQRFPEGNQKKIIRRFYRTHIKKDGLFLLTMITHHAGALFCSELIESLWHNYLQKHHIHNLHELTVLPSPGLEPSPGLDQVDCDKSTLLSELPWSRPASDTDKTHIV